MTLAEIAEIRERACIFLSHEDYPGDIAGMDVLALCDSLEAAQRDTEHLRRTFAALEGRWKKLTAFEREIEELHLRNTALEHNVNFAERQWIETRTELEAAQRDSARLDWLERNFTNVFAFYNQNRWLGFCARRFPGERFCNMADLRTAVDAALWPDEDRGLAVPEPDAGHAGAE